MGESEEKPRRGRVAVESEAGKPNFRYIAGAGRRMQRNKERMLRCEIAEEKIYRLDPTNSKSKKITKLEWKEIDISELAQFEERPISRCIYCHGRVKLFFKKTERGVDHCEHAFFEDSEGCEKGFYYDGAGHRLSKHPLE